MVILSRDTKKRLATCAYSYLAGNRKQDLHQRPWTASFPQKFQIETASVTYKHDSWSMCRYHSVCSMHEKSIMFKRLSESLLERNRAWRRFLLEVPKKKPRRWGKLWDGKLCSEWPADSKNS